MDIKKFEVGQLWYYHGPWNKMNVMDDSLRKGEVNQRMTPRPVILIAKNMDKDNVYTILPLSTSMPRIAKYPTIDTGAVSYCLMDNMIKVHVSTLRNYMGRLDDDTYAMIKKNIAKYFNIDQTDNSDESSDDYYDAFMDDVSEFRRLLDHYETIHDKTIEYAIDIRDRILKNISKIIPLSETYFGEYGEKLIAPSQHETLLNIIAELNDEYPINTIKPDNIDISDLEISEDSNALNQLISNILDKIEMLIYEYLDNANSSNGNKTIASIYYKMEQVEFYISQSEKSIGEENIEKFNLLNDLIKEIDESNKKKEPIQEELHGEIPQEKIKESSLSAIDKINLKKIPLFKRSKTSLNTEEKKILSKLSILDRITMLLNNENFTLLEREWNSEFHTFDTKMKYIMEKPKTRKLNDFHTYMYIFTPNDILLSYNENQRVVYRKKLAIKSIVDTVK